MTTFGEILFSIDLADENATENLGQQLWPCLAPGDVILLQGSLGMGKTTLARGLVRSALCDPMADIPSPTFSLVQTYSTSPMIWHFDLYRLQRSDEIWELGFEDASDGISLIEWPERAAAFMPSTALQISLTSTLSGRCASFAIASESGHDWREKLSPLIGTT